MRSCRRGAITRVTLRAWRNWQTRRTQNPVPKGVSVRPRPPAPVASGREANPRDRKVEAASNHPAQFAPALCPGAGRHRPRDRHRFRLARSRCRPEAPCRRLRAADQDGLKRPGFSGGGSSASDAEVPAAGRQQDYHAPRQSLGLELQSGWRQHLHDPGDPVHGSGHERPAESGAATYDPGHRHADFEGRQRGDRRELITLAATLPVVADIPIAGLALLVGVDSFMSECMALTNLDCARVRKELARGPAPPAAVSTATGSPN